MFEQYSLLIKKARQDTERITKEYEKLREELNIEFKNETIYELGKMDEYKLKDFSPIEYCEKMKIIENRYDNLEKEKEYRIEEIKKILDEELRVLIGAGTKTTVLEETYRTVGVCAENYYIVCRVWFTLKPRKDIDCKAGDPFKIEFVNVVGCRSRDIVDAITSTSIKSPDGFKIPQFNCNGGVQKVNQFFEKNQLSATQIGWWETWVQQNRPC